MVQTFYFSLHLGAFRWSDGSTPDFYNWDPEGAEPSAKANSSASTLSGYDEECVEMYRKEGTWNDVPCGGSTRGYVCKVAKSKCHYFKIILQD